MLTEIDLLHKYEYNHDITRDKVECSPVSTGVYTGCIHQLMPVTSGYYLKYHQERTSKIYNTHSKQNCDSATS